MIKKLILTLTLIIVMTWSVVYASTPSTITRGRSATYESILSTQTMFLMEKFMMNTMAQDMLWLALTAPTSQESVSKEISELRYLSDDGALNEGLKLPSQTFVRGGDCEDMTLFCVSRLLQLNVGRFGFIIFSRDVNTLEEQGHIAAIVMCPIGILVLDAASGPPGSEREIPLSVYLSQIKMGGQFTHYRMHWFFEANTENKIEKL